MRILFLTRRFYPDIGGVEKHALEVAKELVRRGNAVTMVSESFTSEESLTDSFTSGESFGHPRGVFNVYKISVFRNEKLKKFQIWWWLWKNRNLIEEAEIVHCHDVFFWYLPFRFLFPKKPVFITFHGWEGKFPVPKRYILARKVYEKLSWGNICVGDYLKKWYGTKPNFITYGGVGGPEGSGGKEGKEGKKGKIVFVGRLEEDIGLPIYLKTLDILQQIKVNFRIEFYGDGSLRKEAEKYGKVFGFVENVLPKMEQADIVFASSYLAILEALSLGKVVISTWDNQLKEDYLEFSPFSKYIIIASDGNIIAKKLIKITQNPNLVKDVVKSGKKWARGETWEKVTDLYLRLWVTKERGRWGR